MWEIDDLDRQKFDESEKIASVGECKGWTYAKIKKSKNQKSITIAGTR